MKKTLLSMLGVSLLLLGSCAKETPIDGRGGSNGTMQLTVELEKLTRAGGATRAEEVPSEAGEDKVNSLYLLFFEDSADGSGRYITYTPVAMPAPDPVTNPDGNYNMSLNVSIAYPAGTSSSGAYSILALANISDDIYIDGTVGEWMSQWTDKTENYVISHAVAQLPSLGFSSSALLMHGNYRKSAGSDRVNMLLGRDVARIDVTNDVSDWEIASVSVWNSYPETFMLGEGVMDYSDNTERIRKHYEVAPNTTDGNIRGGLYAFENKVRAPKSNDNISTCLIIGLQPVDGSGAVEFYRVNLQNDNGSQDLCRNLAYNLVIDSRKGPGEKSEDTAYLGEGNKLVYHIGEWGEDTSDMIVSDGSSTLGIPVKTVNMGRDASSAELKIYTFSTLASPAPLSIRNQTYRPIANSAGNSPIWARLEGNTLIIESTDMDPGETERRGAITLSFAGLEKTISVSQSGTHDNFLIVTEPDGGILPFGAYSGIPSGLINVKASGHWTAKLVMTGFSFDSKQAVDPVKMIWTNPEGTFTDGRGSNTNLGLIVPDENDLLTNKFRVYTHSYNTEDAPREAFILITLDGMEDDYSASIMLTQDNAEKIDLATSDTGTALTETPTVYFDGTGKLKTGPGYENNVATFWVRPATEDGKILEWGPKFSGTEPAQFTSNYTWDADVMANNQITVDVAKDALGRPMQNLSGRDYEAIVRVEVDPGTFSEIVVVQQAMSLDLDPVAFGSNILAQGGDTEWVTVVTEEGAKWSASGLDFRQTSNVRKDGHRMVNHQKPTLVLRDKTTGDPVEFVEGKEYDSSVQFALRMPPIYYPNRGVGVTGEVTVSIGGASKTIYAVQSPLIPERMLTASRGWNGPGFLRGPITTNVETSGLRLYLGTNNYNSTDGIRSIRTFSVVKDGTAANTPQTLISEDQNVRYIHFTSVGSNSSATWGSVILSTADGMARFKDKGYGVTFALINNNSHTSSLAAINENVEGTKMYAFGSNTGSVAQDVSTAGNTKLGQYFSTHAPYQAAGAWSGGNGSPSFSVGGATSVSSWPDSAYPLMKNGNNAGIVIDPKNRIVLFTSSAYFDQTSVPTERRMQTIWYSLRIFVSKTAMYGRSFSDMFVEKADGGVPAPWDSYWGANAVTGITGVTSGALDSGNFLSSDPINDGLPIPEGWTALPPLSY